MMPLDGEARQTAAVHPDDNRIAQYVDGKLDEEAANAISSHLAGCAECRAVLSGVMRAERRDAPTALDVDPPKDVLRQHLANVAARREAAAGAFIAVVSGLSVLGSGTAWLVFGELHPAGFLSAVPWFVYGATLWAVLGRGWYRAWIPTVTTLCEVVFIVLNLLVIARASGPEAMVRSPVTVIWGGLLVFSSVRANWRLSIGAGTLSAIASIGLALAFPSPGTPSGLVIGVVRSIMLLSCGVGGVLVARYFLREAEGSLRLMREQDLLGRYVLHKLIGVGGMAEVYLATYCPEGGFRKTVVVKRVLPAWSENERFATAFLEEARLGALLNHPNVVQVLDCGKFNGTFVVALEYVDGTNLSALLATFGPLPGCAVAFLGVALCEGLTYIHERTDSEGQPLRLVHRDLNPPNVLLSRVGEVKLGDFGVASATTRSAISERDGFYGKVAYAAPEQLTNGPIDGRTDLFALGVTLVEALTGKRPTGKTGLNLPSDVPPALRELLGSMLEPQAGLRPASATQVREVLLRLEGAFAPYPAGRQALTERVRGTAARPVPRVTATAPATTESVITRRER